MFFNNKNLNKIGRPPGSLVYTGSGEKTDILINHIKFNLNNFENIQSKNIDSDLIDLKYVNWIKILGLSDVQKIEEIKSIVEIDKLNLEDILNVGQRPKIEVHDEYIFLVLKILSFDEKAFKLKEEQISFVLTKNILITFQENKNDIFKNILERMDKNVGNIRKNKADYLLYAIIDSIVDINFNILNIIESKIEITEDNIINNKESNIISEIYKLRKELLLLKTSIWPLKEILYQLRETRAFISSNTAKYIKDIIDHIISIMDFVTIYREMINSMFESHQTNVSNKMNQIMTTLTIFSAVFIPLTFLAGIYGMNFEHIPELSFKYSYPIFLFTCFLVAFSMIRFFRYKKWL